jgi:hypothetical protein
MDQAKKTALPCAVAPFIASIGNLPRLSRLTKDAFFKKSAR